MSVKTVLGLSGLVPALVLGAACTAPRQAGPTKVMAQARAPLPDPKLVPGAGIPGTRHGGDLYPLNWRGEIWLSQELDGPTSAGITNAYDTLLIGPMIALRKALTALQASTLEADAPDKPVLARFEIYDAWSDYNHVEYIGPPTLEDDRSPFRMRALLYWVYRRADSDTPIGSVRLRYHAKSRGTMKHGAQLGHVVVEKREFVVRPQSSRKLGTSIVQEDWEVVGEGKIVETETRIVGDYNDAVVFFDISQRAFEKFKAQGAFGKPK
ncbi:MAG: hypothetical protein ACR2HJ_11915 [Fimbriimonadales bacterium]